MDFDTSTPRAERTIAGRKVTVIAPFAEGMALTAATAAMLNQTIAENFSNNLRKTIEAGNPETGEAFDDAQVQAIVDNYMSTYQPGVRQGGGGGTTRVTDPVEREARKLAKSRVLDAVKAKGMKSKDVDVADLTEKVYEANKEALTAQARAIVKALEKAAAGTAELSLDLGLGDAA